jgi:polyketide cyclase/dehydrase/lipid transport protein
MWEYEHSAESTAAPEAVWRLYEDVANWTAWDPVIRDPALHGPFAVGSEVTLNTSGKDRITLMITELSAGEMFVEETALEGATLRFVHRLTPNADGGTRVTHRVEIVGPASGRIGHDVGPAVAVGFPEAVTNLAKLAQEPAAPSRS